MGDGIVTTFEDTEVVLADLFVPMVRLGKQPVIEGYIFKRCRIVGPALLAFTGMVQMHTVSFDAGGLDEFVWDVEEGAVKVGCVGLTDCLFEDCTFAGVAIAATPATRESIEEAFTTGSWP